MVMPNKLHMFMVPLSNLVHETYSDCGCLWFSSASLGNCRHTVLYGAKIACVYILSKTFPLVDTTKYEEFTVTSNTQKTQELCVKRNNEARSIFARWTLLSSSYYLTPWCHTMLFFKVIDKIQNIVTTIGVLVYRVFTNEWCSFKS